MDLTECSLCNEHYNESNHRARNLMCGHYYCQHCLNQIINSATPRCPSCRADISARSVETLPPNFLMDDLISKMKTELQTRSNEGNDEDFTAGDCPKHKKCQLYFTCKSHKVKICRDCTVLEHNPSRCQIISFEEEMKETKESNISNLKTQKSKREKNIKDLQDIITDSQATIQEHQKEIDRLQNKVNESKQIVDKANAGIRDCKENKSKIESVQQELVSSITINQIKKSSEKAEDIIRASNSLGNSMESNFNITGFQVLTDQKPVALVKKVLGCNATHATAEVNGEKRFAQLVVKNGDVHLPALASGNISPALNKTVTVASLLTRYTNTAIYLTLASGGKELGTVYVKLLDNDYAEYIRKVCMGTIGPCYRGAKFDHKFSSYFFTGDVSQYDASSCTESPPTWPGVVAAKKGMVFIACKTGLGFIVSGGNWLYAVGDVINGMSVVEEAHKYGQGQVSISDVGIVLK